MARPTSMLNRILDGVLKILADDARLNPEDWNRVPQQFVRGVGPHLENLAETIVAVSLNGSRDPITIRPQGYQSSTLSFTVTAILYGTGIETDLGEMASDICRVLMANRQLKLVDDPTIPTLENGYVDLGKATFTANSDPVLGQAAFEQEVVVRYVWSVDAP